MVIKKTNRNIKKIYVAFGADIVNKKSKNINI